MISILWYIPYLFVLLGRFGVPRLLRGSWVLICNQFSGVLLLLDQLRFPDPWWWKPVRFLFAKHFPVSLIFFRDGDLFSVLLGILGQLGCYWGGCGTFLTQLFYNSLLFFLCHRLCNHSSNSLLGLFIPVKGPHDNVLCPCRDTLLDMSTRYLWVQGFSGSVVQWFRGGLDDQVETEVERNPMDCKIRQRQS